MDGHGLIIDLIRALENCRDDTLENFKKDLASELYDLKHRYELLEF